MVEGGGGGEALHRAIAGETYSSNSNPCDECHRVGECSQVHQIIVENATATNDVTCGCYERYREDSFGVCKFIMPPPHMPTTPQHEITTKQSEPSSAIEPTASTDVVTTSHSLHNTSRVTGGFQPQSLAPQSKAAPAIISSKTVTTDMSSKTVPTKSTTTNSRNLTTTTTKNSVTSPLVVKPSSGTMKSTKQDYPWSTSSTLHARTNKDVTTIVKGSVATVGGVVFVVIIVAAFIITYQSRRGKTLQESEEGKYIYIYSFLET